MAKHYSEKPVDKWNTNDFIGYLADKHEQTYGVEYVPPGRQWQVERGLIGTLIGTAGKNAKPRKYEPALVKRFIDECFRTHKLNGFSGVSFTWFWKWKTEIWQQVLVEQLRVKAAAEDTVSDEELDDWL